MIFMTNLPGYHRPGRPVRQIDPSAAPGATNFRGKPKNKVAPIDTKGIAALSGRSESRLNRLVRRNVGALLRWAPKKKTPADRAGVYEFHGGGDLSTLP
ncbi:hypothetical protein [Lysobacter enzymogenes]|uniref:hypothetical protein n=1 Tax=Lysobacter enzymogenes TaxID=69 RepID=UPI001AF6E3B1|nr:hypothetical protein [Lysobacter enzymogenes]QQP99909.1 hypothetical protein JHW41_17590 [Lysobacter enzymogenes]